MKKLTTPEIEIAVARYLNPRTNLIVPNISWGMFIHECDLLVITKSGCAWEIEIKVSKADLIKDKKKRHGHNNKKIRFLYFAIPDYLQSEIEHIPERAGIIIVSEFLKCKTIRQPKPSSDYRFSEIDRYKVARLGSMRIWGLKENVLRYRKQQNNLEAK